MPSTSMRVLVATAAAAAFFFVSCEAFAQGAEQKPPDKPQTGDTKEPQKKDDFAEAEKLLSGPAGNPECVWFGRRVVNLLSRDDLDTAFRHLELYDRFGCPAGHVQATFRCLLRQGFDPKATDTLNARVHACWLNPTSATQGTAAATSGTTNR
jgi:hypothetical protein